MPLTLAHPALVLPLRGAGLPMTALVVGSMVPDVPRISGETQVYRWTHSAWGVVSLDPLLGVLALGLWLWFYRQPLVDLCPERWRSRLAPTVTLSRREYLLCLPALAVGAATHVLWDGLTHGGEWGVRLFGFLDDTYAGTHGYTWAQNLFGGVGLLIVVVAVFRYLSALPPAYPRGEPLMERSVLWVILGVGLLLGLGVSALVIPWGFLAMAFYGVLTSGLVVGFGVTCVCVIWHLKHAYRTR